MYDPNRNSLQLNMSSWAARQYLVGLTRVCESLFGRDDPEQAAALAALLSNGQRQIALRLDTRGTATHFLARRGYCQDCTHYDKVRHALYNLAGDGITPLIFAASDTIEDRLHPTFGISAITDVLRTMEEALQLIGMSPPPQVPGKARRAPLHHRPDQTNHVPEPPHPNTHAPHPSFNESEGFGIAVASPQN